jgi:murein DD-endopeptidase MepM/ murein hydrolase activator NlpD
MITAIHHKMTPIAHNMILEIAKDSFHTAFQAIERAPPPTPPAADDPEGQAEQQNGTSPSSPGPVNKAGWTHPTGGQGRVSSKPGPRKSPGGVGSTSHKGYDIALPKGSPIYAAKAGTVTKAGWQDAGNRKKGYGLRVEIDHGGGYTSRYAHAVEGSISVKVGDKVKAGQQIMKCNSTGSSTGHHLHFEIRLNGNFQDPGPYIS